MIETWNFRHDTMDQLIFDGVVAFNEYQLPVRFAPDDVVIDVGAHIGSFAHAAALRGCTRIFSLEADHTNYELAAANLQPYTDSGCVQLIQAAVWRSDPNDDQLRCDGYHPFPKSYPGMEGILNTGSGSVLWGAGALVPKVALDDLVDQVTQGGAQRVRLLKLDCEGSEWPILFTSRRLHLIDEICGEFHELGGEFPEISEERAAQQPIFRTERCAKFTIDELVQFLNEAGFAVTHRRHRRPTGALEGMGLFFATRERAPAVQG